jgi:metal-sulfur cluster biosynthetic enzyme
MNQLTPISTEQIWSVLATIPDPEFGLSVVDLGLIYDVRLNGSDVHVVMTLTSEGCPAGAMIHDGIRVALGGLEGVGAVQVDLVWEPAWSPERLTEAAREHLGWKS